MEFEFIGTMALALRHAWLQRICRPKQVSSGVKTLDLALLATCKMGTDTE